MEYGHAHSGNFSHLAMSAIFSAVLLVGVVSWQTERMIQTKNANLQSVAAVGVSASGGSAEGDLATQLDSGVATSSSPEEISQIGTNAIGELATYYAVATQKTPYTPELGAQIVATVAPTVDAHVAYPMYSTTMIPTSPDTSYARKLAYRTDLQTSLKALLKNKKYELDVYNEYVQTRDASYLAQLKAAADNYRSAAASTALVVVPINAVSYQVGILNAMQEFAATLDAMADNADDPITSLTLLKSYNQAEADMTSSFTALNAYFVQK